MYFHKREPDAHAISKVWTAICEVGKKPILFGHVSCLLSPSHRLLPHGCQAVPEVLERVSLAREKVILQTRYYLCASKSVFLIMTMLLLKHKRKCFL